MKTKGLKSIRVKVYDPLNDIGETGFHLKWTNEKACRKYYTRQVRAHIKFFKTVFSAELGIRKPKLEISYIYN